MKIVRTNSDIVLALFVLAITAMLLIPLPTFLLDLLLVINISISLLLLLVGLYMPNALALLSFPSLLLLTTLFRLALNVASTRLILSQGEAGSVIEAFGTFLVRGEIVVGIIIFSIITIVNFIVIARGSSRVSEVAARFALDALPGKQAAIDSDLRAGNLTSEEARQKREDLRKESQLYGSMDGAMKFVQGDAIAGFFIIITNIVGGIYLGVSKGATFAEAINTYTTLTVGDGLVHQIPALLISICAGIVVTRVSSGDNTTLGADVGAQLFSKPSTIALAGFILIFMGLLPGLPKAPFFIVAALFLAGGYFLSRVQTADSAAVPRKLDLPGGSVALISAPAQEDEAAEDQQIVIALDSAFLFKLYRQNLHPYSVWWQEFRGDFLNETGIKLPDIKFVADDLLAPSTFSIYVSGTLVQTESIILDSLLVEVNPDSASLLGLEVLREAGHPLSGNRIFWAAQSPSLRKILDAANIRGYDFVQYISLKVAVFFLDHPEEILTITEVHSSLKQIEKRYPGLASDVFSRNFIDLPRLAELMQELVRQGINVRDFKQIVESVAAYCSANGISLAESENLNLDDLVRHVRQSRKRQVLSRQLSARGTLKVFTLSEQLEELVDQMPDDGGFGPLPLDADTFENMSAGLKSLLRPVWSRGLSPVSLLVRGELRKKIELFIRSSNDKIRVLTFEELDPSIDIEQIGVWAI